MVDFEYARAVDPGDAIGAAVEARTEDDDLRHAVFQLHAQEVVDEPRPRNSRGARTGPHQIAETAHEPTELAVPAGEGDHPLQPRPQEADGEAVVEESIAAPTRGFEGAK